METVHYSVKINASKERVWDILWGDLTYPEWTSVFSEGSAIVTDWEKGSKVLFLSGTDDGMYSVIEEKIPNEYMSFKHLGMVKEGKELPIDEDTKKWSGSLEKYSLKETDDMTILKVDLDTEESSVESFNKLFPVALKKVKDLAEDQ